MYEKDIDFVLKRYKDLFGFNLFLYGRYGKPQVFK